MTSAAPALIFDLDGTLADHRRRPDDDAQRHSRARGACGVALASARNMVGAGARALIVRGFAQDGQSLPPENLQRLFGEFVEYYDAHIADHSRLFPGAEAALDRAAWDGDRLAVCTNKLERSSHLLLRALGIADRFQFVCGEDTFDVAKPDPRPLVETIARVGGDLAKSIMVGDSRSDVGAARAAGIPVITVDFGYATFPLLNCIPDQVISHFDELEAAVAAIRGGG